MIWKSTVAGFALLGGIGSNLDVRAQTNPLLVSLDGKNAGATWVNAGSLDDFTPVGNPVVETVAGLTAVTFSGAGDAFVGPNASAELGGNEPRTVEVWVYNPQVDDEETMVSWGLRSSTRDGLNMAFNYGMSSTVGAVNPWGGNMGMGWGLPVPAAGQWHFLAFTYDGATARVYADGVLSNERAVILKTEVEAPLTIGAQNDASGRPQPGFSGSLSIARVRIRASALDAGQVLTNYLADLGALNSIALKVNSKMFVGGKQTPSVVGVYNLLADVKIPDLTASALSSSDTNVLTVGTDGAITALAAGTAKVKVSYRGLQAEQSITVGEAPKASLVHRYRFDDEADSWAALDDVTGAASPVYGGATFTGDGALVLDGNDGYADLPNGIVSSLSDATFDLWVTWDGEGNEGSHIFDFGNNTSGEDFQGDGTSYLALSPAAGNGGARFAANGGAGEEAVEAAAALTPGKETHLTVVHSHSTLEQRLYVDGLWVGTAPVNVALSSISDVNDWLGRSQFATQPNFRGRFHEFRIYNGALTPDQVFLSQAAGPNQVADQAGGLKSLAWQAPVSPVLAGSLLQAQVYANFENLTNIDITAQPETTYQSADASVARVWASGQIDALAVGTAAVVAEYKGIRATNRFEVVAAPGVPEVAELKNRYGFGEAEGATEVIDSIGGANGQVEGGAAVFGNDRLTLNGSRVVLPPGLLSGYTNVTIEAWVRWTGTTNDEQSIFDFGSTHAALGEALTWFNLFVNRSNSPTPGFAVATPTLAESVLRSASALPPNRPVQLVLSYDPVVNVSRLYLNGARIATGTASHALSELGDANNYLGDGQGTPSRPFYGAFDEFRIYNGAMLDAEVATRYSDGPNALPGPSEPPSLAIVRNGASRVLTWPSSATGFLLESTDTLKSNAVWQAVSTTPVVSGTNNTITLDTATGRAFFRLRK